MNAADAHRVLASKVRWAARQERWSLLVVAGASVVAAVVWGTTTRPMGDSYGYRVAGQVITGGWTEVTERTPGYPLLMWLTGSLHDETVLLFVVQATMHALAVLIVVRVASHIGLPTRWRVAIAVLLVMPAPMVKVVYAGSEALTELLVAVSLWLFVRWWERRSVSTLWWLGGVIGALAWVRPTFQLMWLPVGALVWIVARRSAGASRPAWVSAGAVALPAVVCVVSLSGWNAARFDSPGMTPMLGWFLGSRTSVFVQELPDSDEPLRSLLVAERDRRVLLGPETDAENYQFGIAEEISEVTGLSGVELDRFMMRLNLGLIASNPFDYATAVRTSAAAYTGMDAEPAASGPGRLGGWLQSAAHLLLVAAFVVPAVTVPGLALRGDLTPRTLAVLGYATLVTLYVAAVSCLVQTGSPRLRAPTDPLLVLIGVTGWWILTSVVRSRATDPTG